MRQSMKIAESGSPTARERADALRARLPEPAADPVHAAIADSRRLMSAVRRARRAPEFVSGRSAEDDTASDALWLHLRGTLFRTAPTTPAGAVALAQHALNFNRSEGRVLDEKDLIQVLTLIAAVPAV
ncbi:hypothetical protein MKK55_26255 [Methylobacterium sp. J-059]|uniref:hypothetical protein n=1 Tax=Methylobacterium sp. J-059 TaxID=2836643 RepID=UPI001FBB64B5|nr:hypothetical protein [Methylobacterium sp. J-059]MCJ2042425.1 hypothetical protein [Methylobacterium sp. J-059]